MRYEVNRSLWTELPARCVTCFICLLWENFQSQLTFHQHSHTKDYKICLPLEHHALVRVPTQDYTSAGLSLCTATSLLGTTPSTLTIRSFTPCLGVCSLSTSVYLVQVAIQCPIWPPYTCINAHQLPQWALVPMGGCGLPQMGCSLCFDPCSPSMGV